MKFSTIYDRKKSSISFDPATSKTVQDMKRNCDINYIVQQYVTTGTLPTMGRTAFVRREPFFGDFSDVTDFQTMQNTLKARESAFASLPARVRAKFKNDPNELLKAIESLENASKAEIEDLVQLGILEKSALKRFSAVTGTELTSPSVSQGAGSEVASAEGA